jgi:hypothetical protein
MNTINTKEIVLSLIKDDLTNTKLTLGLDELGLDAELYLLNLPDTIFLLLEIEDNPKGEELFEHYLSLKEKVQTINLKTENNVLDKLSSEIYEELMLKK